MYEARAKFAELVDQAAAGETIVVTRKGKPVVELRPVVDQTELDALVDEILSYDFVAGESVVETIRQARDERG